MMAGVRTFVASPRFTQALTETIVGMALATFAVRALLGWPGSIAVLSSLVLLAGLSLAGQPERIEWRGVLPLSLIALFSLITVSIIWSQYTWATVGGIAYFEAPPGCAEFVRASSLAPGGSGGGGE